MITSSSSSSPLPPTIAQPRTVITSGVAGGGGRRGGGGGVAGGAGGEIESVTFARSIANDGSFLWSSVLTGANALPPSPFYGARVFWVRLSVSGRTGRDVVYGDSPLFAIQADGSISVTSPIEGQLIELSSSSSSSFSSSSSNSARGTVEVTWNGNSGLRADGFVELQLYRNGTW